MLALKRIFVTGATGFIGSHLCLALRRANYSVTAVARGEMSGLLNRFGNCSIEWVRIQDAIKIVENIKPDAIIHLATDYGDASGLHRTLIANEAWPLGILEAGIRAGTKIFLNTDSFFGKKNFSYPHMRSYTLSKSHFLAWGKLTVQGTQTRFITLRLEHVFGENDRPNKFVPSLLRQLKAGESVDLTAGEQRRDFIYAGDVASAFVTVLGNYTALEPEVDELEVGTGRSISVKSFVEIAKLLCDSKSILHFGGVPTRKNEIMNSFANTSYLRKLGWEPQSNLEDALRGCIANDFLGR